MKFTTDVIFFFQFGIYNYERLENNERVMLK